MGAIDFLRKVLHMPVCMGLAAAYHTGEFKRFRQQAQLVEASVELAQCLPWLWVLWLHCSGKLAP